MNQQVDTRTMDLIPERIKECLKMKEMISKQLKDLDASIEKWEALLDILKARTTRQ